MEHAVAVALHHLGMDVEARVAKLGDLLGQQLHAVYRVAEDNRLVDLELRDPRAVPSVTTAVLWPEHTPCEASLPQPLVDLQLVSGFLERPQADMWPKPRQVETMLLTC